MKKIKIKGDLNGDGRISRVDFALFTILYEVGLSPQDLGIDYENADINGDGIVDETDYRLLEKMTKGLVEIENYTFKEF